MTDSNNGDRLDRIENLLEQFIAASIADRQASNERLTRVEQIVESNNRFLESFSADLKTYTESLNNLTTRMSGMIATANSDRQEINSRLSVIGQQVNAIAKKLEVDR